MTNAPQPIKISYKTLVSDPASVRADIEAALGNGEGSLGVILVCGEYEYGLRKWEVGGGWSANVGLAWGRGYDMI
jgi:hypothetical protein